ncbi:MAG: hypothetical protein J7M15_03720 [Anaerolineae bacterium]|nr:hypothetical protein [Anaerolineae bacterium]
MNYREAILARRHDPGALEVFYRGLARSEVRSFAQAIEALHAEHPDDLLLASWHHRLLPEERGGDAARRWGLAVAIGLLTGLALWWLWPHGMDYSTTPQLQALGTWGALVIALGVVAYLGVVGGRLRNAALVALVGFAACAGYVWLVARPGGTVMEDQYATVAYIHLPLLAYAAVAVAVLGWRSEAGERFAFLAKTVEVVFTGGVFAVVGMFFFLVTMGLFDTLSLQLPRWLQELVAIVGAGALPVLAVATVYDPTHAPEDQAFDVGLGRVVSVLMRLLLPLALLVLVGYVVAIPFRFMEPFYRRESLIIYNILLFAVLGLLVAVIPVERDTADRAQRVVRVGIVALAALTVLISLYALAAVAYRTALDGWTVNRVTVIGWNVLNTSLLGLLLVRQIRSWHDDWIGACHRSVRGGTVAYLVWGLVVILALPWVF